MGSLRTFGVSVLAQQSLARRRRPLQNALAR